MKKDKHVRVSDKTYKIINELAEKEGRTIKATIDWLVKKYMEKE